MAEAPTGDKKVLLILSIHQDLGEAFIQDACEEVAEGVGTFKAGETGFSVEVLAGDPRLNPTWEEAVRRADAMLLLSRFLDVISLDKTKSIYRRLPSDKTVPLSVVVYREKGESDYKMSCPACGQKLWVRDSDVGKRGRCPNCKKAFKLPSQDNLVRSQLMLPDTVTLTTVNKGDAASCRNAVESLAGRLTGIVEGKFDTQVLKKTTVRVQLPDDTSIDPQ